MFRIKWIGNWDSGGATGGDFILFAKSKEIAERKALKQLQKDKNHNCDSYWVEATKDFKMERISYDLEVNNLKEET